MTPGLNALMSFLIGISVAASGAPVNTPTDAPPLAAAVFSSSAASSTPVVIPDVPFYSQFEDIHEAAWQKVGCGVTSLAMIIAYYHPGVVSVETLLHEAIASGAYIKGAGWSHQGLVLLAHRYGLTGKSYDLAELGSADAFVQLRAFLTDGPVIVSVHYKFDPQSTIPHLVVITGIVGDRVYYNDPALHTSGQSISTAEFLGGWKKRFIVISPE